MGEFDISQTTFRTAIPKDHAGGSPAVFTTNTSAVTPTTTVTEAPSEPSEPSVLETITLEGATPVVLTSPNVTNLEGVSFVNGVLDFGNRDVIIMPSSILSFGSASISVSEIKAKSLKIVFPKPLSLFIALTITTTGGDVTLLGNTAIDGINSQALTINSAGAVTLGGTFNSGANALSVTSGTGQPINFSTTLTTELTGSTVDLVSTGGTPIVSDQNLSVTTKSGDLNLTGAFNVGTGKITLTAGSVGSGNGVIKYTNVTLTATMIDLIQRGPFAPSPPATFQDPDGATLTPQINDLSSTTTTYTAPSWAVCFPSSPGGCSATATVTAGDIEITSADDKNTDGTIDAAEINAIIDAKFTLSNAGGLNIGAHSFTINFAGDIVFPARLTEIRTATGDISITANNISGGFSNTFKLITISATTAGDITLNGVFDYASSTIDINSGSSLNFATTKATSLTGTSVALTAASAPTLGTFDLTLTTETGGTGNITLSGNFGVAGKALTITSVGQINFTGTTTLTGGVVELNTANASAASGAVTLVGTTSLNLIGNTFNFGTNDLTLESPMINEPTIGTRGALTIDAGAANISLQSWMNENNKNLTLKTSGELTPVTLDIGNGTLTLTTTGSGFIRLLAHQSGTSTTLTAGNVILTSANAQNPETNGALTITAATSITLEGMFSTGDRAMTLTATDGTITFTNADLTASEINLTQNGAFDANTPATFSVKPAIHNTDAGAPYTPPTWASCLAADPNCNIPQVDIDITQANDITLINVLGGFEIDGDGVLDLGTYSLTLITDGKIIVPSTLTKITTSGTITIVTAANTDSTGSPDSDTQFGPNGDELIFSTGGISGLPANATLTIEITGGAVAADIDSSEIDLTIARVFAAQDDDNNHPAFDLVLKTNGQLSMELLGQFDRVIARAAIKATNLTIDAPYLDGFGGEGGPSNKIYGDTTIKFLNLKKVTSDRVRDATKLIMVVGSGGITYPTTGDDANAEDAFSGYIVDIENIHPSSNVLTIGSWALQAARTVITSTTRPILIAESVTTNNLEINAPRIIFDGADGAGGVNADIVITVAESIQLNATDDDTTTTAFTAINGNGNQNLTISQKNRGYFHSVFYKGCL